VQIRIQNSFAWERCFSDFSSGCVKVSILLWNLGGN
jgi:hypothetical protein